MMSKDLLYLDVNVNGILDAVRGLEGAEERIAQKVGDLAAQAHLRIIESAQQKLHTRREMYLEALNFVEVSPMLHVIELEAKARWIEDGMPEHEMIDDLLMGGKPPKIVKSGKHKGKKYKVIPFQHNKGPTKQTPAQQDLTATLKAALKKEKVPYGKIEKDEATGLPKEGKLHEFNFDTSHTNETKPHTPMGPTGPHESWTAAGPRSHRQRNTPRPAGQEGPGGRPFLWGVRVYQKILRDAKTGEMLRTKKGNIRAQRSIMTFRIVGEWQKGTGKWNYPGIEGMGFLDDAYEWAKREWEQNIEPEIISELLFRR